MLAPFGDLILQDVRFGLRTLRKNPAFTVVAVLSLALGIGANTTVFCWIQNILLRPFAGAAKQEELRIVMASRGSATWGGLVSVPDLIDQGQLTNIFTGVIGSTVTRADLTTDGRSEWIYGQITTANYFGVLGVQPLLGRTWLPEEDQPAGGHPVIVLSERFWKRRFAGDPHIIGRTLMVNRTGFTVVGIVPKAFRGTLTGFNCDFWAPLSMCEEVMHMPKGYLVTRSERWVQAQARLQPGVKPARAQAALDTLAAQLDNAYPDSNRDVRLRLLPLWKAPYGAQPLMLPVLGLLQAVSLIVLLIVAVNMANLLLARATRREKEVAIRLAIGAGRGRLIRQLLTESVLLSIIGGLGGVLLACWLVEVIQFFIPKYPAPIGFSTSLTARTLGSSLLLALATGILFGLAPALQASRPHVNESLKEGGRGAAAGTPRHRLLNVFVVSQIALAMVLLICAGLCLKGLRHARQIDLGFDPTHLLYMGFNMEMNGDPARRIVFCDQLRQRLVSLSGVQSVGFANWYPLGFDPSVAGSTVEAEGYPRRPNEDLNVSFTYISPGYLATMRIPLYEGRDFTDRDDGNSLPVAIINQAMANRFWPGQNAIGRKFVAGGTRRTVVGVAKTGKYRSLAEPSSYFFYIPIRQWPYSILGGICVRTTGNPLSLANSVRNEMQKLDPEVSIWATLPMIDYIQPVFMTQQVASSLLTLLGVIALALAAIGVYGVMAYVVGQRRHEFGIRMALGAQREDVLRLVLRRGLMLGVLGATVGLALALAATRHLANFLYGVSPFDALTLAGVPLLLGILTLFASWLPALRAAQAEPMEALRHE
ncbi:MAG TPA: ABC transporter permease [Candidatus Limnocylindrales bacterium]|jgi:predicted permease|nr:ABC transporter permease [Candidatus Limnocylindrales bacterium]